jgi:hypothetical protein
MRDGDVNLERLGRHLYEGRTAPAVVEVESAK